MDDDYEPQDYSLWLKKYGSQQLAEERLEELIRQVRQERGYCRLLDIGMHMFGDYCLKPFMESIRPCLDVYVGIDPSPHTFQGVTSTADDLRVIQAFGEYLPLRNTQFNMAVSVATFDHLFDPKRCLRELSRVLEPNGLLLIQSNNNGAWFKRLFPRAAEKRRKISRQFHNNFWNVSEMKSLVEQHGFQVLQIRCNRYNPVVDNPMVGRRLPYHLHIVICQFTDVVGRLLLPRSGGNFSILCQKTSESLAQPEALDIHHLKLKNSGTTA